MISLERVGWMTIALLMATTSAMPALEEETDVVLWTNAIPDSAQRARDLPVLMSQVEDPTVGIDIGMVIRLAIAMAQDCDKGVDEGFEAESQRRVREWPV